MVSERNKISNKLLWVMIADAGRTAVSSRLLTCGALAASKVGTARLGTHTVNQVTHKQFIATHTNYFNINYFSWKGQELYQI